MKRLIYIILAISIFLTSCEKEVIEQPKELSLTQGEGIILNKEQHIYDLESTDVIEITSNDTLVYEQQKFPRYEIEIEGESEELEQIVPGSVIYIPSGEHGGILAFVAEVEQVSNSGGRTSGLVRIIVKGIQATLDMYFNNIDNTELKFSTPENRTKKNSLFADKKYYPETLIGPLDIDENFDFKGIQIEVESTNESLLKVDFSSDIWRDGDSYINLGGFFNFNPSLDFYMRYEPQKVSRNSQRAQELLDWIEAILVPDILLAFDEKNFKLGNLKELQTTLYADIDTELDFRIHLENGIDDEKKIPIGAVKLPTHPISADFELYFVVDFNAIGTFDLEANYKQENDILITFYKLGDNDPDWHSEFDKTKESSFKVKAEIEIQTGIKLLLETEIYVCGVLGPEISAAACVDANAKFQSIIGEQNSYSWELDVEAGFEASSTLNLSLFHSDKATWKFWEILTLGEKKEKWTTLYHAPDKILVESGNNQIGNLGQPLNNPIVIGAYDSREKLIKYLPVPIHMVAQHGSIEPSGMLSTTDGIVTTSWTLDNSSNEQFLNAYLKYDEEIIDELTITANAESSPIDGPVAYYPFNGNVDDESGNGNHGTLNGAIPTTDRFGNVNSAFMFNGSSDYINTQIDTDILDNLYSVSFWIHSTDYSNGGQDTWITGDYSGNGNGWGIYCDNNESTNFIFFGDDVSNDPSTPVSNLNNGSWYHIVGITENDKHVLYINGQKIAESYNQWNSSASTLIIGNFQTNQNGFNGKIDDYRLYDYALTDSDIQELYTENGWTGNQQNETGTFIDSRDNKEYGWVKIGNQTWMSENLAATEYTDGTPIPHVTGVTEWANLSTPAYSWYDNDEATYGDTYGALYNWYTARRSDLCPVGWSSPTDNDWIELELYLGLNQIEVQDNGWRGTTQGYELKSTSGWYNDGNGSNVHDFNALPGGWRNLNGVFEFVGENGIWWTSSQSTENSSRGIGRTLEYDKTEIGKSLYTQKEYGLSVRCIKD